MIIEDLSHTVPSPTRYFNKLHRYATWRKMTVLQRPRNRGLPQCHARPRWRASSSHYLSIQANIRLRMDVCEVGIAYGKTRIDVRRRSQRSRRGITWLSSMYLSLIHLSYMLAKIDRNCFMSRR